MAITRACIDRFRSNISTEFQHVTANTWFKVKGSKVKVTAYVTANTDSAHNAHAHCAVGGSAPHGRCQAHLAKRPKTIFSNQTSPKNPERLAQCRSAFEMQCFCNCTLPSLLLTKGVAHVTCICGCHAELPKTQYFRTKNPQNADNMPDRLALSRSGH